MFLKTKYILLFLILVMTGFFEFIFIRPEIQTVIVFYFVVRYFREKRNKVFDKAIYVFFIGVILSIISCLIYRKQSVIQSIWALHNTWTLALFFFFASKKVTAKDIVWTIKVLGYGILILYILQYFLFINGIYLRNYSESIIRKGASVRFRMPATAAIFLIYFDVLYHFLRKFSYIRLLTLAAIIVAVLLMGFRTITAGIALATVIMLFFSGLPMRKVIPWVIVISLAGLLVTTNEFVMSRIDNMMQRNESQNLENENYIRVICYDYFTNQHFTNDMERFLGSGEFNRSSAYGKYMTSLMDDKKLFYNDWGIIGLSWLLGITTVVGILLYVIKLARVNVGMPYINIWIVFLLLISVLTGEFYRAGNYLIQALILAYVAKIDTGKRYVLSLKRKEKKKLKYQNQYMIL